MKVKALLKRLRGYERFKDVLKAIQMVAASDLKEIKNELLVRFFFLSSFLCFFSNIDTNQVSSCIVFPFTVDKNCCGPHNFNIFESTKVVIDQVTNDYSSDFSLFTLGDRAKHFFIARYPKKKIRFFSAVRRDEISLLLTDIIAEKFLSYKSDLYLILFNKFYTVFNLEPTLYEICSYDLFLKSFSDAEKISDSPDLIVTILQYNELKELYKFSVSLFILDAFFENEYCSIAGRINSMSNAYKNIQDVISETTLIYNKARQEQITNELLEVGLHVI
jgi:F-type H+-transporting ATPase subunit gamma